MKPILWYSYWETGIENNTKPLIFMAEKKLKKVEIKCFCYGFSL